MGLIDFILNLAGLLLWLGWRSIHFDPLSSSAPATLAGTLRRAEPRRAKSWKFLVALAVLLLLRAWLYCQVGPQADWHPKLDLTFVVLAFGSNRFLPTLLFSVLSFARILIICYFWLLALVVINRRNAEPDPVHRILRQHLGAVARWPWLLQALLPLVLVAGLWVALHPLLVRLDIIAPTHANTHLVEQGLLVAVALFLTLQYLLPVFLFAHLIASYIYLGANPLWDFVAATARNLLAPLQPVPLRIAKFDFAPIVGVVLIFLLLHWVPNLMVSAMATPVAGITGPDERLHGAHWLWPQ
jgi:uncharacterized protein YggT (Ycf19 family)